MSTLPKGTINYFPKPWNADEHSELWPDDNSDPFDGSPLNGNNEICRAAPYTLMEAPLLNYNASGYAGYQILGGVQEPLFYNDQTPTIDIPWTFVIDKPIDLKLINPGEQIIYNPEEAIIDIDGSQYPERTLVFPFGYTFKTVQGTHPDRAAVEAVDPLSTYPDPRNAPVPSTLGSTSSTYVVRAGNTLVIEPCVTIMDAVIVVESGATVRMNQNQVYGNYTLDTSPGGTVEYLDWATIEKPCPAECHGDAGYERKDVIINGTQTWSPGNVWFDTDQDDVLRIGGLVRVKEGAVLTIEPGLKLAFGPFGRMVVERGARVEAEEVTFTSACEQMWQGIEVWGTQDAGQLPVIGNTDQGVFIAIECQFENAHLALLAGRRDGHFGAVYNGGILKALNNTFRNCGADVHIPPTKNMHLGIELANQCFIAHNTFITDRKLIAAGYHDGFGLPRAPTHHVLLAV
ncbi:MAG: hypothetical protein JNM31_02365 [Flavobacteriales bacterium]|nr:hypothetical protein [Flavobacteriales bacterium]